LAAVVKDDDERSPGLEIFSLAFLSCGKIATCFEKKNCRHEKKKFRELERFARQHLRCFALSLEIFSGTIMVLFSGTRIKNF